MFLLNRNKKLDKDNFIKALVAEFEEDLFPENTGSYVIKKTVSLDDDVAVILHSVGHYNDSSGHYINVHVHVKSNYSEELCAYLVSLAEYSFRFDFDTNIWSCTRELRFGNMTNKYVNLLNDWCTLMNPLVL